MSEMNIINIKREISDELIEHVLCCAFEGGITYWANNVSCEDNKDMKKVSGWKHEYLTKTKKKDAVMYIHDLESEEKYPITKKSIIDALQKMDNFNNYRQALDRILNETYDADDADIMVQIACFKEVIYG
jgi:hypothetical protein